MYMCVLVDSKPWDLYRYIYVNYGNYFQRAQDVVRADQDEEGAVQDEE